MCSVKCALHRPNAAEGTVPKHAAIPVILLLTELVHPLTDKDGVQVC